MAKNRDCEHYRLNDFSKKSTENLDQFTAMILHCCDYPRDKMTGQPVVGNLRCNTELDFCPHNPSNN